MFNRNRRKIRFATQYEIKQNKNMKKTKLNKTVYLLIMLVLIQKLRKKKSVAKS